MKHSPTLVEWWKRSACRQGATLAFTLALAHHPDISIPEIAAGFPAGAVSEAIVERLLESASAYASKVERIVDMDDYLPTVLMEEDEAKAPTS
jgi:predicted transcriptional regulator